jgi:hypothetical protein
MIQVLSFFFFAVLFFGAPAEAIPFGAEKCPHMTVYDYASSMCMPYAMEGMPMKMFMLNVNVECECFSERIRDRWGSWAKRPLLNQHDHGGRWDQRGE